MNTRAKAGSWKTYVAYACVCGIFQSLILSAYAANLGDCSGDWENWLAKSCGNKDYTCSGCTDVIDVANGCAAGFSWDATLVDDADRIRTGTCGTSAGDVCAQCQGLITTCKGAVKRQNDCSIDCGKTGYVQTLGTRCI